MPDKCLRFLMKTIRRLVISRSPSAAVLMFACLLGPNFVAAQSPQNTEPVDVLDANSATVATLFVPRSSIQISEIAVLINDNDPQSVEVASYYQKVRKIPTRNMIHLNFDQDKMYPGFTSNNGIRIGLLDTESDDPDWREFDFDPDQAEMIGQALVRWAQRSRAQAEIIRCGIKG